jgi:hypothetical protein
MQQQANDWKNYQGTLNATPGAIDPSKYSTAADMAAAVTQAQYSDWKNTFLPASQAMLNQTTFNNPGLVQQGVTQAVGNVNQAFDTAAGVQQRLATHAGIADDPTLSAVTSKVNNVQRSASVVDAANRIRQNLSDRNTSIMQSGTPHFAAQL